MAIKVLVCGNAGMPREAVSICLGSRFGFETPDPCPPERLAEAVTDTGPDVVVLMPTFGSLPEKTEEAVAAISDTGTRVPLVVISYRPDASEARAAMRGGAQALVAVAEPLDSLDAAILAASADEFYVSPDIGSQIARIPANGSENLGKAERDVLRLAAHGYSNEQIADELHLSKRTVETRRASMIRKLGLADRQELVRYALNHRLIP